MDNSKYESVASSSKVDTKPQNTQDTKDSASTSSNNVERNASSYPDDQVDYKTELSVNLEQIEAYAHLAQSTASDMLSGSPKQQVDEIISEGKEKFDDLKELSSAIDLSNSENNDPQVEKLAVEKANEACDALLDSVAQTNAILQKNVVITHKSDMDNYNENLSDLENLRGTRAEYTTKYTGILDSSINNKEDSEEFSLTNKGKGRALDSYPEDSDESSVTNKGRALDSYPENTEQSVKKPKTGESLIDDYADPSTEPGDWTGGDD